MGQMRTADFKSPLVSLLCIAVALFLAVAQPFAFLFFFLIPFLFFVATVPGVRIAIVQELYRALPLLALPVSSPRPPPLVRFVR